MENWKKLKKIQKLKKKMKNSKKKLKKIGKFKKKLENSKWNKWMELVDVLQGNVGIAGGFRIALAHGHRTQRLPRIGVGRQGIAGRHGPTPQGRNQRWRIANSSSSHRAPLLVQVHRQRRLSVARRLPPSLHSLFLDFSFIEALMHFLNQSWKTWKYQKHAEI